MFEPHENEYVKVTDDLDFDDYFEYKLIRTNKQISYYNDIIAFDIETTSFLDEDIDYIESDISVYEYLKGRKIKISKKLYHDIPDLAYFRRILFGRLYFSEHSGTAPDLLYQELMDIFPSYFPDDIYNPADCLEKILEVFSSQIPVKETDDHKRAVMYVWQLAINGKVIIGRTWSQFIDLINEISEHFGLNEKKRMIIYVHNLAFEFQFMKDLFEWIKVFAIKARKPIFAICKQGIEFRCSYMLSNLSLANMGKSLTTFNIQKLSGDLDYTLKRHYKTPLKFSELRYCINDVLTMSCWIYEQIQQEPHKNITELPLTATGYCRNFVRKSCLSGPGRQGQKEQFNKYHGMIKGLTISGALEYELMQRAFMGGFTHANANFAGRLIIDDGISSFDLSSAYPGALCAFDEYPMSKGEKINITSYKELNKNCKLYCCIFDVTFKGLIPKTLTENYISISKCWKEDHKPLKDEDKADIVTNNGRVVSGDISTTITNIDYEIIKQMYDWDEIEIGTFYRYKKGYLPREFLAAVLSLYKDKVSLKNVAGMEDFYMKSKQILNACYGMICTSINMPVNTYQDGKWTIEHKDIEKALKTYNKSKKRFLYFPWAIFCTALVRRTILSGILSFGADSYLYSDTDSIKAIHAEKHMDFIENYNAYITRKLEKMCDHYNFDYELIRPKTKEGKIKPLGIFENETEKGKWLAFVSLGAKRYLVMEHDHNVTMTVSGLNKKVTTPYLINKYGKYGLFENFNQDLYIPGENSGKMTHTYIDDKMEGYITDYLGQTVKYESMSGIYLEPADYNFSLEKDYLAYLKKMQGEYFNL